MSGKPGDVQRTDRADDEPRLEDLRRPVRVPDADVPGARRLVPRQGRHRGAEAAVRTELVLVEHADEVVAQFGLLAVVLGPVMRRLERVAVVMTADVDPRTRVPVLPPGTTRTLVLLDDHERKAGLRQADPREDAGQATADHDDRRRSLRLVRHLVAPRDRAAVGAVELHVLEEHRHHDPLERLAREERHHLDEDVSGQLVRDAPAVPVGGDGRHRASPDVGKLLVVEPALQVRGVRHGPERQLADPRRIPRHVHQRAQQHGNGHVLERGGDGGVVVGERFTDVRVPYVVTAVSLGGSETRPEHAVEQAGEAGFEVVAPERVVAPRAVDLGVARRRLRAAP